MTEILDVISPPDVEPVSLAQAKAVCNALEYTYDDVYISTLIPMAREYAEAILKQSLVNRQYLWTIDYFPNRAVVTPNSVIWETLQSRIYPYTQAQVLYLPKPPLVSVDSVTYYDSNGTLQTLDPSSYQVVAGTPGRMAPNPGSMYPASQDRLGAVQITFTAGRGPDASDVNPGIQGAILTLVAYWYRNREAASDDGLVAIPFGFKNMLACFKHGGYW